MTDHEKRERLREFGLRLRRDHEYAMASIPPLNEEVRQLAAGELMHRAAYRGDVILCEPYESTDEASGRAYLAVLSSTRGFGAVQLDTEERPGEISADDVERRMNLFADLPVRLQARMASQVNVLLDQLLYDLSLQ